MVRVAVIVSVLDRMNHDSLIVDSEDGIGRDVDPVFCSKVSTESVPE